MAASGLQPPRPGAADDRLDSEIEAIASRLAGFHHDAILRTQSYVDRVTPREA